VEDFADTLGAAQLGDEGAFTTLFREFNPAVVRYLAVLAGRDLAEDLAAETWVAALRGFAAFAGDEKSLRAWLLTIARARWVDSVRAHTRRPELVTDAPPELPSAEDVHEQVERGFTTDWALRLIATLPPEQAEVITLRVVGQLEVADVAELTGKTANHVRVLTHRGLKRLAQALGDPAAMADQEERL